MYKLSIKVDKDKDKIQIESFNKLKVFYQQQKYKIDEEKKKLINKKS